MWVKLSQNPRQGFLHQVVGVDGIDIFVVDDVQQVVNLVAAGIDDAEPVAREVVGIECSYQDAYHHADGHQQGHETVCCLLFCHFSVLSLSCYVVIEVKIGKFEFADLGQLGGYVVACNHILKKEGRDNPTIGLLICKEKDKVQAQYAVESSSQPLAISEYELEKFYPEKVEGTIPTIEEIEAKLSERLEENHGNV